jgi:hypothetical protein
MSVRLATLLLFVCANPVLAQEPGKDATFTFWIEGEPVQVAPEEGASDGAQTYNLFERQDASYEIPEGAPAEAKKNAVNLTAADAKTDLLEMIKKEHRATQAARLELLKLRTKAHEARFAALQQSLHEQRELQINQLGESADTPIGKDLLERFDKMQSGAIDRLKSAMGEVAAADQQAKELIELRRQQEESTLGELHRRRTFGDMDTITLAVEFERASLARLTAQRAVAEQKGTDRIQELARTAQKLRENGQADAADEVDATAKMFSFLATSEPNPAPLRLNPAKTAPFHIDADLMRVPEATKKPELAPPK